jgi:ubiquinone/menaquinone biosynthesis C-methylase UbiE
MNATLEGQVTRSAADVYEAFFVPALFAEWAPRVADAGRLAPGDAVLDVACGTGVLARHALGRVGPGGLVVGLDRNDGTVEFQAPAHIVTATKS